MIFNDLMLFRVTFHLLCQVNITLANTTPDALFFVVCVVGGGLAVRAYTQKRIGMTTVTVHRQVAAMVTPEWPTTMQPRLGEGQKIMVAARGVTPVLAFALDEAVLRKATLYVLYVKEIAVYYTGGPTERGRPKWQNDPEANAIMSLMRKLGAERDVCVLTAHPVSEDTATTIHDLSDTLGVDFLVSGAT